jgi:hypothetical protein
LRGLAAAAGTVVIAVGGVLGPGVTAQASAQAAGESGVAGGDYSVNVQAPADLTGGTTSSVQIVGPPSTRVLVAQCAAPLVAANLSGNHCRPPAPTNLTLDASGSGGLAMVLHASIGPSEISAERVECGADRCVVAAFTDEGDGDGPLFAQAPIGFRTASGPLSITVAPDTDLANFQFVDVAVGGREDQIVELYQCDASIETSGRDPSAEDAPCTRVNEAFIAEPGSTVRVVNMPVVRTLFAAGRAWECSVAPGRCLVVGQSADGTDVASAPIAFAPIGSLTLTPAAGLVDHQPMALHAGGLRPGGTYAVVRCTSPGIGMSPHHPCEDPTTAPPVVASASGEVDATVEALQHMTLVDGFAAACTPACHVALLATDPGGRGIEALAPYEMAAGSLAAVPATGLTDGQVITLTGTDLLDSYDGPDIWIFSTGAWGVMQCDRAVADDLSVAGIFGHCGVPPEGAAVTVDGAQLAAPVTVQATVHEVFGGTTECTTAPDACVLLLARIEQNRFVTTHLAPISFP